MFQKHREGLLIFPLLASLLLVGCTAGQRDSAQAAAPPAQGKPATSTAEAAGPRWADVVSVEVTGSANAYQFSVEIASPDTGCQQYADWWEVVSGEGQLIYRRILLHSHVGEQPFTRSGGPVAVAPDAVVWVRAHMHPGGYGGDVFRGSVQDGFGQVQPGTNFAADLEDAAPQPDECAF